MRRLLRQLLFPALVLAGLACQEGPVEVSETELWTLVLEQLTDYADTAEVRLPRRGTIVVRLRLNHTAQPDPVCDNAPITTVLASAETAASRLQPTASGSFDGSWNCLGMVGTLRLGDGTTYELASTVGSGQFAKFTDNTWRAGARQGVFKLIHDDHATSTTDSHLDVLIRNQSSDDLVFALADSLPETADGVTRQYWPVSIAAGGFFEGSWPAHAPPPATTPELRLWVVWRSDELIRGPLTCVLGSDHPTRVEIRLLDDRRHECASGWLGQTYLAGPDQIFLKGGESAQYDLTSVGIGSVWATTSDSRVHASTAAVGTGWRLTVSADAGTPLLAYDLTLWGRNSYGSNDSIWTAGTINVHDLQVGLAPDTVAIAPGDTGSALVYLHRRGISAAFAQVDLSVGATTLPMIASGVSPRPTLDTTARFVTRLAPDAEPGTYDVPICASFVADTRSHCVAGHLTVVVATPPPLIGNPTRMAAVDSVLAPGVVGTEAALLPSVRVTDSLDRPVPGVIVTFQPGTGSGSLAVAQVATDTNGIARPAGWIYGTVPGTQTIRALAPDGSAIRPTSLLFSVTVAPGAPASFVVVAGAGQSAAAGTAVPIPPRVAVRDRFGNGVAGVPILFGIELGGGAVTGNSRTTDAAGEAAVGSWTLGPVPGSNILIATMGGPFAGFVTPNQRAISATGTP